MASIEVMKERARIASRFNLSACRSSKYRNIVASVALKSNGECHVIPAAPIEKVNDVARRGWGSAGGCKKLCRGLVFSSRVLAW